MYKLLNLLFGWDYVLRASEAYSSYLEPSRIYKDKAGKVFCKHHASFVRVKKTDNMGWLTCHPSKYFPEDQKK